MGIEQQRSKLLQLLRRIALYDDGDGKVWAPTGRSSEGFCTVCGSETCFAFVESLHGYRFPAMRRYPFSHYKSCYCSDQADHLHLGMWRCERCGDIPPMPCA